MAQIEALAVGPIASMSQHQQSGWKASYDPASDHIARLALLESLGYRVRLPVYELIGSGGRSSASPSIAWISCVEASLRSPWTILLLRAKADSPRLRYPLTHLTALRYGIEASDATTRSG